MNDLDNSVKRETATDTVRIPHYSDVAIIIPARDEAGRIHRALNSIASLASPISCRVHTVIVANNCQDQTVERARNAMSDNHLSGKVISVDLPDNRGVGAARQIGADYALHHLGAISAFLFTDADSYVDSQWLARTLMHLELVDVVCGQIMIDSQEAKQLPWVKTEWLEWEALYLDLSLQLKTLMNPDGVNRWPHHGRVGGASLAIRRSSFYRIGGFSNLLCGEDRDLVSRSLQHGMLVKYADDVCVTTSGRLQGRAPGGMADTLRERSLQAEYVVDEMLEPASTLLLRLHAQQECRRRWIQQQSLAPLYRLLCIDPPVTTHRSIPTCWQAVWASIESVSPLLTAHRLYAHELPKHIQSLEHALRKVNGSNSPPERNFQRHRSVLNSYSAH